MKKTKQLILFLIPTLIVILVFVLPNQQNVFVVDNSDSDAGAAKVEASTKHINHNSSSLISRALSGIDGAPILTANGNVLISAFLYNPDDVLSSIKNHSPPINIAV